MTSGTGEENRSNYCLSFIKQQQREVRGEGRGGVGGWGGGGVSGGRGVTRTSSREDWKELNGCRNYVGLK